MLECIMEVGGRSYFPYARDDQKLSFHPKIYHIMTASLKEL